MESDMPVKNMSPEKKVLTPDLNDAGDSESDPQKSKDLWFDDGSIIVISGKAAFCVHRSVLSMNSPIFKDMFMLNDYHNDSSAEPATVHFPDAESDVRHFLKALYNRRCVACLYSSPLLEELNFCQLFHCWDTHTL